MPPETDAPGDLVDINEEDGVGIENAEEFGATLINGASIPDDGKSELDIVLAAPDTESKTGKSPAPPVSTKSSGGKRAYKPAPPRLTPEMAALEAKWSGKLLGKFKLSKMLGHGGMGIVFQAKDIHLKRPVALKVLRRRIAGTDKAERVELFLREARAAASIDHPNIVQIFEISQVQGWWYIAMEYLEGGSIRQLVKTAGPLDPLRACMVGADAARGLEEAHEAGIIHRDIKPANLMLARKGRCKVADFGLVRFEDPDDPFRINNQMVGTPLYLAPEIVRKKPAAAASDIYALGTSLYYMLTAKVPFKAESRTEIYRLQIQGAIPDVRALAPVCSENLANIIKATMAKDPKDRPSAATLAMILQNEVASLSPGGAYTSWGSTMMMPAITSGSTAIGMTAIEAYPNKPSPNTGDSSTVKPSSRLSNRTYRFHTVATAAVVGIAVGAGTIGVISMMFGHHDSPQAPNQSGAAMADPVPPTADEASPEMIHAINAQAQAYAYWRQVNPMDRAEGFNQKLMDTEVTKNRADAYFKAQRWSEARQDYDLFLTQARQLLEAERGRQAALAARTALEEIVRSVGASPHPQTPALVAAESNRQAGQDEFNKGNFVEAIAHWKAASENYRQSAALAVFASNSAAGSSATTQPAPGVK